MAATAASGTTEARPTAPFGASRVYLVAGTALTAAQAAGLLGRFADASFLVLSLGCLVAITVGVRRHRPSLRWPWAMLAAVVVIFLVGATAREALGSLGDLTAQRAVTPDVITLVGYVLLAWAFTGMIRARYRHRSDDVDALLDAAVAALAALCLAWVFLIVPALRTEESPLTVRIVLAAYPMISAFLVAITARLAFSAGRRPGISLRLLLAAMVLLLVGDAGFMLAELGILQLETHVLGAPYALVQVAAAAAALHPSMRELTRPLAAVETGPTRNRIAAVAVALVIPGVITAVRPLQDGDDWIGPAIIITALTAAAVARMVRALQAHHRSEQRLVHHASHDDLTGLPNRQHLMATLPARVAAAHDAGNQLAVLFLDIDRFKYVNDSLGHGVGDRVLTTVARRLTAAVRADDVVARMGGDEFAIVLPEVTCLGEALEVAERVRLSFQVPLEADGARVVVSTSVGVVLSESAQHSATDLVRSADTAMYQAKDLGRNAVAVFDRSMLDRSARRLVLDGELREAEHGTALHVAYQPLVDLPDGRIEGFEALMRWTHPTLGHIGPDEFIPLAEDNGLIVELGAWILDESCRQIAEWRRTIPDGESLHVSVNVSARQLADGNFPATVADVLRRWSLPPDALWLELTESLLLDDPAKTQAALEALRALGVKLSVDDFGTGYSSLAYLKRFPVDRVKIDAAFVGGLDEAGSSDESLVAAIVAMAAALGLSTLAEGIETEAQAERLRKLDVTAGQGYLFARPLAATDVLDAVERLGTAGDGQVVDLNSVRQTG